MFDFQQICRKDSVFNRLQAQYQSTLPIQRGKFCRGEYTQLFRLYLKRKIPLALVSAGLASAAALHSVSDAVLQKKKCESAGGSEEEDDLHRPHKLGLHRKMRLTQSAEPKE